MSGTVGSVGERYEVTEIDDSGTLPVRRVVYSGCSRETADRWLDHLRFRASHELRVDGALEGSFQVALGHRDRPRPRSTFDRLMDELRGR